MANAGRWTLVVALGMGLVGALSNPAAAGEDSAWKKWMKDYVVPAKTAGDYAKLAELNAKISAANPDPAAFPKWKEFCDQGIAAAKKADKDALNKSCTACHNEYRKLFKEKYRAAPLPK